MNIDKAGEAMGLKWFPCSVNLNQDLELFQLGQELGEVSILYYLYLLGAFAKNKDGLLPNDLDSISRVTNIPKENIPALVEKLKTLELIGETKGRKLYSPFICKEITTFNAIREKKSKAGKASAASRAASACDSDQGSMSLSSQVDDEAMSNAKSIEPLPNTPNTCSTHAEPINEMKCNDMECTVPDISTPNPNSTNTSTSTIINVLGDRESERKGGKVKGKGRASKAAMGLDLLIAGVVMPINLDTEIGHKALRDWLEYKADKHQGYKNPKYVNTLLGQETWAHATDTDFARAVSSSIGSNYAGLFSPKLAVYPSNTPSKAQQRKLDFEALARANGVILRDTSLTPDEDVFDAQFSKVM